MIFKCFKDQLNTVYDILNEDNHIREYPPPPWTEPYSPQQNFQFKEEFC